jgi:hypothetical protein
MVVKIRIKNATIVVLLEIFCLTLSSNLSVRAIKNGTFPGGSTIMNRVTKHFMKKVR